MTNNWRNNRRLIVHSRQSMANIGLLFVTMIMLMLVSCRKNKDHANHDQHQFTCPMHPAVVSDKPGLCPICGMNLTLKKNEEKEVQITQSLANLLTSPNEAVVSSIKTIQAKYKGVPTNMQAQGVVTYDTRNVYTIPTRVGGRLEKVYLKYVFQHITKGQKIAEIYSPELITAQRELLYMLEYDPQNSELIQSAKTKLILLGVSETQLTTLIQRKEILNTFSIYSPYTGYVIMKGDQISSTNTPTATSSTPDNGMDLMGSSSGSSANIGPDQLSQFSSLLREGNYVSANQTLFNVVNPSSLRIELDLPASQAVNIKKGTSLYLDTGDENETEAVVDFIQPFFTDGEAFVKLRIYTNNAEELHIGQLIKAKLDIKTTQSLWLPREAVLDLGLRQIVFLKENGVFKPKKITTGTKAEGHIEVKQGLTPSDEIASNAQYLIDSESFVKVN